MQKNSEIAYYFYKTDDKNALKYLKLKEIDIKTNGDDLIKLGYSQGKLFSKIFNSLLEEKLSEKEKLQTKKEEIEFIKTNFPK